MTKLVSRILLGMLFALASQYAVAQTRLTVSQALDFWISRSEEMVVTTAEAMPEEKYLFAPTAGEFAGDGREPCRHFTQCGQPIAALKQAVFLAQFVAKPRARSSHLLSPVRW